LKEEFVQLVLILAAAAAQQSSDVQPGPEAQTETIVITASREPVAEADSPASATVFGREAIEALSLPLAADMLRLAPGVSVAASGPAGSQTDIRIRGAEANHTLLFVDGIRFNDPASGNAARFELLAADQLSRMELVRGPQSALWGSEALGGVVAVETANPFDRRGLSALAEYGSHDSRRLSGQFAARAGEIGVSGSAGWLRSDGIDAFGRGGERDGFENLSASLKAVFAPIASAEIGLVGHYVDGESEFDGFDPATFRRADTLDATDNRIAAVRGWGSLRSGDWSFSADAAYLDSANRNRLDASALNSTSGSRLAFGGEASRRIGRHKVTAAVEHEREEFRARDQVFFGGTDQDQARDLTALVGQWRAEWSQAFITDVAVRRDSFSAFKDATNVRAAILYRPARALTVHAAYGEGVAQPTFYDLFGFFPGSFQGNPDLRPERSRGLEAGLRWQQGASSIGITGFSNRLEDEILDVFDPVTFVSSTANATGKSRRRGIELDGRTRWRGIDLLANYTHLDAGERQNAGGATVREVRRARHSANVFASGTLAAIELGAGLSYVGPREDTDFEVFPARRVRLDDYVLGSVRLGWNLTRDIQAFARVENLFDADYEDVFGYNTAGRTVHAGLRLRLGR
jgi:vitamin B12 transporter